MKLPIWLAKGFLLHGSVLGRRLALVLSFGWRFRSIRLPPPPRPVADRFRVVQIREGLKSGSLSLPEAQAASSATAPAPAAVAAVAAVAPGVAKSATAARLWTGDAGRQGVRLPLLVVPSCGSVPVEVLK